MSQHDDDLHDEGLSRLYRRGRASEPGRAVDERIRQAAHRAVERRWPAWWKLASTAAVLVLSLGLVLETLVRVPIEPPGVESGVFDERAPALRDEAFEPAAEPLPQAVIDLQGIDERSLHSAREKAAVSAPARQLGEPEQRYTAPAPAAPVSSASPPSDEAMFEREAEQDSTGPLPSPIEVESACDGFVPPQSDDPAEWQRVAAGLRAQGERARLACLEAAYEARFGESLPGE